MATLFGSLAPVGAEDSDLSPYTLGLKFNVTSDTFISGIRFYRDGPRWDGLTVTLILWNADTQTSIRGATRVLTADDGIGWVIVPFGVNINVFAATNYVVTYSYPTGGFPYTHDSGASVVTSLLTTPAAPASLYISDPAPQFPVGTSTNNYFVDVVAGIATLAANAGPDQTVESASLAHLHGTAIPAAGEIATWTWTQVSGPTVTLVGTGPDRTFMAPGLMETSTLVFGLTVTDTSSPAVSPQDKVTVTVPPATMFEAYGGEWVAISSTQLDD